MCTPTRIDRYYWRCGDCLGVFAVNGKESGMDCACGGRCECMGQVNGFVLTETTLQCACDGRCTCARGPNCDCSCGGANHGTGAVVEVTRIVGKLPVATNNPRFEIATEFRAAVASCRIRIKAMENYGWAYWAGMKLTKAIQSNSHKKRMEILAKI